MSGVPSANCHEPRTTTHDPRTLHPVRRHAISHHLMPGLGISFLLRENL